MSSKQKAKEKDVVGTLSSSAPRSSDEICVVLQGLFKLDKAVSSENDGLLTCPCIDCDHSFACKVIGKKNAKDIALHIFNYHLRSLIENCGSKFVSEEIRINAFLSPSLENYCNIWMKKSTKVNEKKVQLELLAETIYTTFFVTGSSVATDLNDETVAEEDATASQTQPPATPSSKITKASSTTELNSSTEAIASPALAKATPGTGRKKKTEDSSNQESSVATSKTRAKKASASNTAPLEVTSEEGTKVRALILDPTLDKHIATAERQRVQIGIYELERVKTLFKDQGLELGATNNKALTTFMREIEDFLNKGKMTREEVTSKGDDVFDFTRCVTEEGDRQGGLDLYTGWSKEEFLTVTDAMASISGVVADGEDKVGGGGGGVVKGGDAGMMISPEYHHWFRKKDNRLFYEVDHIWEVQIMHIAIRELMRFRAAKKKPINNETSTAKATPSDMEENIRTSNFLYKYQLGLVELHYITKLLNSLSNLNCTPWNINLYKGKLMKQFRSTYQIHDTSLNYDLRSYMVGNRNYTFLMKVFPTYQQIWNTSNSKVTKISDEENVASQHPKEEIKKNSLQDSEDIDYNVLAASKYSIMQNIQNAMRNVLTSLFYHQLYAFDASTATARDIGMDASDDVDMMNKMMLNRDVLRLLYGILCHVYQTMFPSS